MKTEAADNPVTPEQKRYIASELNLARLPYFASSRTSAQKRKSIKYNRVIQQEDGELEIEWRVTADAEYGYPGPFAEAVHAAILDVITEDGLPCENPITFTFYDICNRLEIPSSGKNTTNIRRAIRSISSASIWADNAFVDKDGRRQTFYTNSVSLYDRYIGYEEYDPETEERADINKIWLADFFLESLNSGNIRPIDFEYFKHIHDQSYVATKLYRHLGYRFAGTFKHDNPYAKVDYDELASVVDVKRRKYLSRAKQQLERAHQALKETSFIDKIDWHQEKRSNAQNKFLMHYYPGDRARDEYQNGRLAIDRKSEFSLLTSMSEKAEDMQKEKYETDTESSAPEHNISTASGKTSSPMAHELEALGVTPERARELDQEYSEERITRQLDHLEHLSKQGNAPENVGGWLVSAIRKDYSTPDGFKTREERKAEKQARAKAAKRKRKKEQEEKRKRQEEKKRRQQLDERLEALSEDDQQVIEEEIAERIRSDFSDWMRTLYETKEFDPESPMHAGAYYDHLEQILKERDEPE